MKKLLLVSALLLSATTATAAGYKTITSDGDGVCLHYKTVQAEGVVLNVGDDELAEDFRFALCYHNFDNDFATIEGWPAEQCTFQDGNTATVTCANPETADKDVIVVSIDEHSSVFDNITYSRFRQTAKLEVNAVQVMDAKFKKHFF